jgi:hypothetical protein
LRWCENPSDRIAGFRVLQLLPGIGPSTRRQNSKRSRTPSQGDGRAHADRGSQGDGGRLARFCQAVR